MTKLRTSLSVILLTFSFTMSMPVNDSSSPRLNNDQDTTEHLHHDQDINGDKKFIEGTQGVAINRHGRSEFHIRDIERLNCKLYPSDEFLFDSLREYLNNQVKLLELDLQFLNHTSVPLKGNDTDWIYHPTTWSRVGHSHGLTILSLNFNYGSLSLMTLAFGVVRFPVQLYEEPFRCLCGLSEEDKIKVVLDIMLRDFKSNGEMVVLQGERVCHQLIINQSNHASFVDQCCYKSRTEEVIICTTEEPNMYLKLLSFLMVLVYFALLVGGPMVVTSMLDEDILNTVDYIIKLKEPLYKTLTVTETKNNDLITSDHVINLKAKQNFKRCRDVLRDMPRNKIFSIKISEFNISVSYMKLLTENNVPVGVLQSLFRAVFLCRMEEVGTFQDCCESSVYGCRKEKKPRPWITVCRVVGRVLFVFFLPLLYYLRLVFYYMFENEEVLKRREATDAVGLPPHFNYKLLHYLVESYHMRLKTRAVDSI